MQNRFEFTQKKSHDKKQRKKRISSKKKSHEKKQRKKRPPPAKQIPLQDDHVAEDKFFINNYKDIFDDNKIQIPKAFDLETLLKAIKFKSSSLWHLHETNALSVKDMQRIAVINGFLLILEWRDWDTKHSLNKNTVIWALEKIGYLTIEWQFVEKTKRGQYFNCLI
jgi:hypothetical protein